MEDQNKVETIDGAQVAYRRFGSGSSVLLLLHGAVGECRLLIDF